MTPQGRRQGLLDGLLHLLLGQAQVEPLLVIVEDLHWSDPSTREFLELLIEQVSLASLLVVLTCRPTFEPPWLLRSGMTPMALHRLPREQVEAMVSPLLAERELSLGRLAEIVDKSDGIPLFAEELTRMVVETEALASAKPGAALGVVEALSIPSTLQDLLMARLDRMGPAKEMAQWGAVLGREFRYAVLCAVVPCEEETLQVALGHLVRADLLFQRGIKPQTMQYRFKHALLQEAAYASMLRRRRQVMHQHVAEVLEAHFPEAIEIQPEVLAHHYTEAGLPEQAIPYWQHAAQRALQRSAYRETIAHLTKSLHLLLDLPETPERGRRELDIHLALGYPLEIVKGQGALEMKHAYSRALELCERVGNTSQHILALRGLHGWHLSRGELQIAKGFAEQAFNLAQQETGSASLPLTHMSLGVTLYYLGQFALARVHSEQGSVRHSAQPSHLSDDRYLSVCPVYEALSLWMLGYPDQALQKSQANIARARTWDHKFRQVFTFCFMAQLHQFRREVGIVRELVEAVLTICQKERFPLYGSYATMLLGWVLSEHHQVAEGLNRLHEGLAVYRAIGSKVSLPYYLSLQAELYSKQGRVADGLQVLTEAFDLADYDAEGHWWKAELYRLKGELLLRAEGEVQRALFTPEACFQEALAVARGQQARSLELRVAMSLARLWYVQGRRQEARDLLAPVYGWFTEGFDTADLKDASGLLAQLAQHG